MRPLVFVHGFMGGGDQWTLQAPLADDQALICVDLPGFGNNADMAPIRTIEGYAHWVLDDLSLAGIAEFDLLGHSMGGMVVQEMVRLAPERIKRLILYGTGTVGALPGRFETIETSVQRARNEGPEATARRITATWFRDGRQSDAFEACAEIAMKSSLAAILVGLGAMNGWSGQEGLAKISCPTLIIWGDLDRTYPYSQTELLHRSISNSELTIIHDCAHVVHLEQPERFNRTLTEFLQDDER